MKHMGWSWREYCETPYSIVCEIIDMMREAQEEFELQRLMNEK